MKKFFTVFIISVLLLSLVSCNGLLSLVIPFETNPRFSTTTEPSAPVLNPEFDGVAVEFLPDESGRVTYTYSELCEDIDLLTKKYGINGVFSVESIGKSLDGRDIFCVILGNRNAEKQIVIQAGIHAREYLSTMLVMKQIEYCLDNYKIEDHSALSYEKLFDEIAFYIVPSANPDGIELVSLGIDAISSEELKGIINEIYLSEEAKGYTTTAGGRKMTLDEYVKLWKANARGVDLNRNYDALWESYKGGEKVPSSKTHKGASPASEPETAAMVELVEGLSNVVATVAVHIQGEVLYWDCNQEGKIYEDCRELATIVSTVNSYRVSTTKTNDASYTDWAVLKKGIPAVTLELGSGFSYSMITMENFERVWQDNCMLFAVLAEHYIN